MALSPAEMDAAVIRNLAGKTGRNLEQWQALLAAAGPFAKPAAAVAWLKSAHSLGHVTAQIIVRTLSSAAMPDDNKADPANDLFGPVGAADRELFEALVAQVQKTLPNATMGARKGYVSFSQRVQFMIVTKTPSMPGLTIGLSDQDRDQPALMRAKGLGGSDRIRFRLQLQDAGGIATVLVHAAAAATGAGSQTT